MQRSPILSAISGSAYGSLVWTDAAGNADHWVISHLHSQFLGVKTGCTSFSLERQHCVFNIPGFPSITHELKVLYAPKLLFGGLRVRIYHEVGL